MNDLRTLEERKWNLHFVLLVFSMAKDGKISDKLFIYITCGSGCELIFY